MECKEFFDANNGNVQKCKLLQEMPQDILIAWESQSASEYSPRILDDDEFLYQQIVDPTHLDPNGRALKPTAFQDSANKGLSTNRLEYSSLAEIVERGVRRATDFNTANPDRPPRTLWGFAPFNVGAVRKILSPSTGTRGFFVYDTALVDDVSHADICQGAKDQKFERSVRFSLYDMAKDALIPLGTGEE